MKLDRRFKFLIKIEFLFIKTIYHVSLAHYRRNVFYSRILTIKKLNKMVRQSFEIVVQVQNKWLFLLVTLKR